MQFLWVFLSVALVAACVAAIWAAAHKAGKNAQQIRALDKENDDVLEAAAIRDRLRHDDDFAKRVRKRFTR